MQTRAVGTGEVAWFGMRMDEGFGQTGRPACCLGLANGLLVCAGPGILAGLRGHGRLGADLIGPQFGQLNGPILALSSSTIKSNKRQYKNK